jgi:hypothetical protein
MNTDLISRNTEQRNSRGKAQKNTNGTAEIDGMKSHETTPIHSPAEVWMKLFWIEIRVYPCSSAANIYRFLSAFICVICG